MLCIYKQKYSQWVYWQHNRHQLNICSNCRNYSICPWEMHLPQNSHTVSRINHHHELAKIAGVAFSLALGIFSVFTGCIQYFNRFLTVKWNQKITYRYFHFKLIFVEFESNVGESSMKKSCWAQNEHLLQVSRERCLQNKFRLLFSVSQLQKVLFNEEKPLWNHKLTVSKASHNGVTNYKLVRLAQRTSFKETFAHIWEQESILLESNFSRLARAALQLRLHPTQGG